MVFVRAFRVQGSGFRVQGSGFRVEEFGFRIQALELRTIAEGRDGHAMELRNNVAHLEQSRHQRSHTWAHL